MESPDQSKEDQADTKTLIKIGAAPRDTPRLPSPCNTMANWVQDYKMDYPYRGKCIIINNKKFEPQINLNERRGTELDAQQLFKVFKLLEFEVKVYHNLSTRDMRMVLESEGKADHSERDCFACCILSHGDRGVIYGTDGKMMTDLVFSPFLGDACPSLAGKPKMFFIQACQGDRLDPGVMVSNGDRRDSGVGSSYVSVPVHADFLIAYSTVPGYYSWRNTSQGSWFIQSLAAVLESNSQDLDLLTMMTLVNHRVAHNFQSCVPGDQEMDRKKQIPYIASMLTRRIFFLPKSG